MRAIPYIGDGPMGGAALALVPPPFGQSTVNTSATGAVGTFNSTANQWDMSAGELWSPKMTAANAPAPWQVLWNNDGYWSQPPWGGFADKSGSNTNRITYQGGTTDGSGNITTPAGGLWLTLFGPARKMLSYTMAPNYGGRQPKSWQVFGSNDNAAWTVVDTQVNVWSGGDTGVRTFTVATPGSYTYYKWLFTQAQPGVTSSYIVDLVYMETSYTLSNGINCTSSASWVQFAPARGVVSFRVTGDVTKLTAFMSRDGGTTMVPVTLSSPVPVGDGSFLISGLADFSQVPTGTTLVAQIASGALSTACSGIFQGASQ